MLAANAGEITQLTLPQGVPCPLEGRRWISHIHGVNSGPSWRRGVHVVIIHGLEHRSYGVVSQFRRGMLSGKEDKGRNHTPPIEFPGALRMIRLLPYPRD